MKKKVKGIYNIAKAFAVKEYYLPRDEVTFHPGGWCNTNAKLNCKSCEQLKQAQYIESHPYHAVMKEIFNNYWKNKEVQKVLKQLTNTDMKTLDIKKSKKKSKEILMDEILQHDGSWFFVGNIKGVMRKNCRVISGYDNGYNYYIHQGKSGGHTLFRNKIQ